MYPCDVRENSTVDFAIATLGDAGTTGGGGAASGTAAVVGRALGCPSTPAPWIVEAHSLRRWCDS